MKSEVLRDIDIQGFTERLSVARRRSGLTQQDVAARLGIHYAHYNEIERGKSTTGVHLNTFYRLCQVLNVDSDWLLGLDILQAAQGWARAQGR